MKIVKVIFIIIVAYFLAVGISSTVGCSPFKIAKEFDKDHLLKQLDTENNEGKVGIHNRIAYLLSRDNYPEANTNGNIRVVTEVGKGSTFIVELPKPDTAKDISTKSPMGRRA